MASDLSQIYYIIDDSSDDVITSFPGGVTPYAFNGTQKSISQIFQITFDGTSILFIGDLSQSISLVATIDDKVMPSVTIGPSNSDVYGRWYQSPTLGDTKDKHTIRLTPPSANIDDVLDLDYIAVTPGMETPLSGKTLQVDDTYSGLNFGSGWQPTNNVLFDPVFSDTTFYSGLPFQNTTHTSSTPGSTFSFSYTGTETGSFACTTMSLYGVFLWEQLGAVELVATVDDQPPVTKTFDARTDTHHGTMLREVNFVLFTTPDLKAGSHTVSFNLTKCVNQTLIIDYITYEPSFSSLATMPNLTGLAFPFPSTIPTTSQSSTSSPSPTKSIPSTQKPPVASKSHVAPLIGGILAGLVLLSCIGFLLFWRHRRRQKQQFPPAWTIATVSDGRLSTVEPFQSPLPTILRPPSQKEQAVSGSNDSGRTRHLTSKTESVESAPPIYPVPSIPENLGRRDTNAEAPRSQSRDVESNGGADRIAAMEIQVQALRAELDALARPPEYHTH
ncbi:hypothetical protein C8J56DRAFT_895110 [Mycena floridula]|nr:hypothetical protein C8J56DRAFT_895110 [Mycena floridula]